MKILKLTANNFKRLSAVEITPDGNVVIISGKNAAGKSSVLDAIEAALCGGRSLPKQSIKIGEHRAEVTVVLGEDENELGELEPEYKVTRKFLGASSTLKVETVGETKSEVKSPQAFLDKIVGDISFDPLAFMKKTPAEQRISMMAFLGLNVDEFDSKIASLKAERSEVRKEKERKLHEADSIVFTPNLPEEEQGCDVLLAELKAIQNHNNDRGLVMAENSVIVSKIENRNNEIVAAKKAIIDWQNRLDGLEKHKTQLESQLSIPTDVIDPAGIEAGIKTLGDTNEAIRQNNLKKQAMVDYDIHTEAYRELGDTIKTTEIRKAQKMAEAVMPVRGLTIKSDGLAFDNIPLEQVNDAKKLDVCVTIAMAMKPKLEVLRINGNDLDTESLLALGQIVDNQGYQVWIEKVSDDSSIGFYIEDGTLIERGSDEKETN